MLPQYALKIWQVKNISSMQQDLYNYIRKIKKYGTCTNPCWNMFVYFQLKFKIVRNKTHTDNFWTLSFRACMRSIRYWPLPAVILILKQCFQKQRVKKLVLFFLSFNKDLSHHRSTVLSRAILTSSRGGTTLGGHKSALK